MIIRKAEPRDAEAIKELYFVYLSPWTPKNEQDMELWKNKIAKFYKDDNIHLLVGEIEGKVISSVQLAIIESLTHDVSPFGVIENVVTHGEYRCKGYASALLQKAINIAQEHGCYKVSLETGSNKESTLNFYRNNGFTIDEKHSCLKRL